MKFDGDNYRSYKVSSLIKKELGQIFITLQNDLLKKIIIKDVEMSRDLSQARIFFDFFCEEFHKDSQKKIFNEQLDNNLKIIRKKIASNLSLKKTPKLKFIYDNSEYKANRIEDLINESLHSK